jgi:hypothetical protein
VLDLVATAQKTGFSLDEIRLLQPPDCARWPCDALSAEVRDIEGLEARLAQNRMRLVSLMAEIAAKSDDVDCATNATRTLARWRVGARSGLEPAAGVTRANRRRSPKSG